VLLLFVAREGLEPSRSFEQQILNLPRLPVPPPGHVSTCLRRGLLYLRWDSNPHTRRHEFLRLACLPIPPLRHFCTANRGRTCTSFRTNEPKSLMSTNSNIAVYHFLCEFANTHHLSKDSSKISGLSPVSTLNRWRFQFWMHP
jgi:hypothetical protein